MLNQLERQKILYMLETGPYNKHTHGRGLRLAKVAVVLALFNLALLAYSMLTH